MQARILSSSEEILSALEDKAPKYIKAFYNSRLGGIILDPAFMSVPIDDHMVHRGHSVFDVIGVVEGRVIMMDRHLRRFEASAKQARIELPMSTQDMKTALLDLVAASKLHNAQIRCWMSTGPGSLGVVPTSGMSTLYAAVTEADYMKPYGEGFKEFTVGVPLKPKFLATMKSTNYLLNALCATESQEKGGRLGVQLDDQGYVTESCVANLAFVLPEQVLVTPPFDKILNGITIERVMHHAQELVKEGRLSGVEQRQIHVSEAKKAVEMLQCSADRVEGIIEWDGESIGTGEVGPVTKYIQQAMLAGNLDQNLTELVPYQRFS